MASAAAKPKSKSKAKARASTTAKGGEPLWLRDQDAPRSEILYKPASTMDALLGVLVSSGGAVLAGAGFFAQFLRKDGPHPYAPYLLLGGVAAFVLGLYLSSRAARDVRVGDSGVAVETSKGTQRIGWHEVEGMGLAAGVLSFRGHGGKLVNISVAAQPHAFARALIEARSRIPARAGQVTSTVKAPPADAGEKVVLPPPQLAGLRCRASDRLIAFEHDARLCGRCGEVFHKETAPERCPSCDARLTG